MGITILRYIKFLKGVKSFIIMCNGTLKNSLQATGNGILLKLKNIQLVIGGDIDYF